MTHLAIYNFIRNLLQIKQNEHETIYILCIHIYCIHMFINATILQVAPIRNVIRSRF